MAATWKAAWATFLAMMYMPSSYAIVLQHNKSEVEAGWRLVRRAPASGTWPEANDNLAGTSVYGTPTTDIDGDSAFSIAFSQESFSKFRISTGDGQYWVEFHKDVLATYFSAQAQQVLSSSENADAHLTSGVWYNRGINADPLISVAGWVDSSSCTAESPQHCWIYVGNSHAGSSADLSWENLASAHGGINVFIDAMSDTITPTPAPPATPAPPPTPGNDAASGTGDPHLKNMRGESFDLLRPGKFLLIDIPRGRPVEDALLVVEADAHRVGGNCADLYFVALNITGAWADMAKTGGLRFDAYATPDEKPKWAKFGPVDLKIAHGRTVQGTRYLNIYARHLGRAGFAVGGLLGEDDHSEAVVPTDGCFKTLSLSRKGAGKGLPHASSVAEAM